MSDNTRDHDGGNGEFCLMCGRSDKTAGKMVHMPGGIPICPDCLQKTMDAASKFDMQSLFNNPMFMQNNPFLKGFMTPDQNKDNEDNAAEAEEVSAPAQADTNVPASSNQAGTVSVEQAENPELSEENEDDEEESKQDGDGRRPSISFLNLGDLFGSGFGGRQQPKVKKKKKNGPKPVFSIDNIPAPHKIKEELDKYIIGQERAKKVISVAAYNHYKRVKTGTMDDIESVISKLLAAADNDVEKTEKGIVFIDEIDKIAKKKNVNSRDVSGESVQQGLLKLLEGADVEVPVGANSKNAMVPLTTINTRNILFICGGAFPDLERIIRERLNKKTSIGFSAEIRDKYDNEKNIMDRVTNDDLRKFGMIPEFIGRLPIVCPLQGLDADMLVKILKEPENAILKQYQKLLALDEVKLEFEDDALYAIAEKALEKDTGARALRSIIEEFMLDIMYEIPKDDNIGTVTITRAYVEGKGGPKIVIRSDYVDKNKQPLLPEKVSGEEYSDSKVTEQN